MSTLSHKNLMSPQVAEQKGQAAPHASVLCNKKRKMRKRSDGGIPFSLYLSPTLIELCFRSLFARVSFMLYVRVRALLPGDRA